MTDKLSYFKEYTQKIYDLDGPMTIYLVKDSKDFDLWGFLYVENASEVNDQHCNQCINEPVLWFKLDSYGILPFKSLCGTIGPTKFNEILNGNKTLMGDIILDIKLLG